MYLALVMLHLTVQDQQRDMELKKSMWNVWKQGEHKTADEEEIQQAVEEGS